MNVQITIRDVPRAVRDELAARAACQGRSMQEFLQEFLGADLERLAARPQREQMLSSLRERKALAGTRVAPDEILAQRDAARR
ncbi:MAG: hypothetical protein KF833_09575 [Verrucomicrobiae bacterium]|nr:hypothetical protein [Verrucomicrobiae bacterium]